MSHLSADELAQWFERGHSTSRDRVIRHLAECGDCRRALSALAIEAGGVDAATPAITVAEAVPRGYAARRPATTTGAWSWRRPAYGLVGAAVAVAAVVWLTLPDRADRVGNPVRGSEVVALSPAGPVTTLVFRWESPYEAARYRLVVRNANGETVLTSEPKGSPFEPDEGLRSRMGGGADYTWQVEALDAAGDVIATSKPVPFRLQP